MVLASLPGGYELVIVAQNGAGLPSSGYEVRVKLVASLPREDMLGLGKVDLSIKWGRGREIKLQKNVPIYLNLGNFNEHLDEFT